MTLEEMFERVTLYPDKGQCRDAYGNFNTGTILKTTNGIHLVGTVNSQLGVCDDCNIKDEKILAIGHIQEILNLID